MRSVGMALSKKKSELLALSEGGAQLGGRSVRGVWFQSEWPFLLLDIILGMGGVGQRGGRLPE